MFLYKIRNIFCVVSATNVVRAGKRANICVGNNVSSFARAYKVETIYIIDRAGKNNGFPFLVILGY